MPNAYFQEFLFEKRKSLFLKDYVLMFPCIGLRIVILNL